MTSPINYSIDVQSPFQAALQGYQGGAAIRNDQLQQQQQQQAMQAQQAQQQALQRLMSNPNPTAKDYSDATLLIPGMKEQFKQAWEMRNTDQQQNDLSHVGQVYAALQSNQPEVAAVLLRDRAKSLRNSGNEQDAKHADVIASVAEANPALAKSMIGLKLSAITGGDKVINGATALNTDQRAAELQPGLVAKGVAEASKAGSEAVTEAVKAGNATTATVLANQKTAQEIKASELAGQISQIDAQIKGANSETQRGELQLKRDELTQKLQQAQQDKGTAAQDGMDAITRGLQTVKSIKEHPGISSNAAWLGGVGSTTGKMAGLIPGTDRKDLEALVSTLKSQQFLANVSTLKGTGALSDAEGARIERAIASLDLDQTPKAFRNALGIIEADMTKAQAKLVARNQLPTKGEAFVMSHPVYGNVTDGQINALMKQFPGSTRDQVLKYLQSTGGK